MGSSMLERERVKDSLKIPLGILDEGFPGNGIVLRPKTKKGLLTMAYRNVDLRKKSIKQIL